tara:strand:+ start:198 stop:395 length:198 start_codon:yes stop_codon:yes gene_type:complete
MQQVKLTYAEMFELYQLTKCAIQGNDDRDLDSAHRKLQKAYYKALNSNMAEHKPNYDYTPPMYGQ